MEILWNRIVAFFFAVLAFFGLWNPPTGGTTPAKDDVTIVGSQIKVQYEANPTTGYLWHCTVDGESVKLKKEEYVAFPSQEGMCGTGGMQYYELEAVKAGRSTVTFTYQRDFEDAPIRTEILVLDVAADGTVTR